MNVQRRSRAAEYSVRGILYLAVNYSEDKVSVIEAMEGPIFLNVCLFHEGYCPRDKVCSVHDVWAEAQKRLVDYLRGCNFAEMAISAAKKTKTFNQRKGGPK